MLLSAHWAVLYWWTNMRWFENWTDRFEYPNWNEFSCTSLSIAQSPNCEIHPKSHTIHFSITQRYFNETLSHFSVLCPNSSIVHAPKRISYRFLPHTYGKLDSPVYRWPRRNDFACCNMLIAFSNTLKWSILNDAVCALRNKTNSIGLALLHTTPNNEVYCFDVLSLFEQRKNARSTD